MRATTLAVVRIGHTKQRGSSPSKVFARHKGQGGAPTPQGYGRSSDQGKLVSAIRVFLVAKQGVDGRDEHGHDDSGLRAPPRIKTFVRPDSATDVPEDDFDVAVLAGAIKDTKEDAADATDAWQRDKLAHKLDQLRALQAALAR